MSNPIPPAPGVPKAAEAESTARHGRLRDTLAYAVLDVFAECAWEGNPLAVVTDARGLSDAQMQQIACETNLSETSFILPRAARIEAEEGVRVRIFTTQEELPFAGHPTLGTAAWMHLFHPMLAGQPRIRLALNVGTIPVEFEARTAQPGVFGTMRQNDPRFGETFGVNAIAAATGLRPEDLDEGIPAQVVSTGTTFCIVPLRFARCRSTAPHRSRASTAVSRPRRSPLLLLRRTDTREQIGRGLPRAHAVLRR